MSRLKLAAVGLAAMLTIALLPGISSAAALPVLGWGPAAPGAPVAVNDVLQASLGGGPATFFIPNTTTGTKCAASTLTDQVIGNPGAPGVAGTKIINQTFGGCTSSIPGVLGVVSVVFNNLPYLETFSDAAGLPVRVQPMAGPIQVTITETVPGAVVTCLWQSGPPLTGSYINLPHLITFTNQPFNFIGGPAGPCGAGLQLFSVTYGPLTDISKPSPSPIWVN